jgi:hypothetical protein
MKSIIFWDMTPCSPLSFNRRFGGTNRRHLKGRRNSFSKTSKQAGGKHNDPEDGGDVFLRNVGWNSTDCTASYPRRWFSPEEKIVLIVTDKSFRRGRERIPTLCEHEVDKSYVFVRARRRSKRQACETQAHLFMTWATLTSEHKINKGHIGSPQSRLHKTQTHSIVGWWTEGCPGLRPLIKGWMARSNKASRHLSLALIYYLCTVFTVKIWV